MHKLPHDDKENDIENWKFSIQIQISNPIIIKDDDILNLWYHEKIIN